MSAWGDQQEQVFAAHWVGTYTMGLLIWAASMREPLEWARCAYHQIRGLDGGVKNRPMSSRSLVRQCM
jgi:hypothetical protein